MKPTPLRCGLAIVTLLTALPALAAERGDADGAPYLEREPSQQARAFTEATCARAGDVAVALTQNLQALQGELFRAFDRTRIEATREFAPLMQRFADQLREWARQLDSAPVPRDS